MFPFASSTIIAYYTNDLQFFTYIAKIEYDDDMDDDSADPRMYDDILDVTNPEHIQYAIDVRRGLIPANQPPPMANDKRCDDCGAVWYYCKCNDSSSSEDEGEEFVPAPQTPPPMAPLTECPDAPVRPREFLTLPEFHTLHPMTPLLGTQSGPARIRAYAVKYSADCNICREFCTLCLCEDPSDQK